jgi:hypothetical protein
MTDKFKPYKFMGSTIYSPKNRVFLEKFASGISGLSQSEKTKINGNHVKYGGINYLIVLNEHGKIRLASIGKSARGSVFLAED